MSVVALKSVISYCRKWKIYGLETSTVNFHRQQREITLYEATALLPHYPCLLLVYYARPKDESCEIMRIHSIPFPKPCACPRTFYPGCLTFG